VSLLLPLSSITFFSLGLFFSPRPLENAGFQNNFPAPPISKGRSRIFLSRSPLLSLFFSIPFPWRRPFSSVLPFVGGRLDVLSFFVFTLPVDPEDELAIHSDRLSFFLCCFGPLFSVSLPVFPKSFRHSSCLCLVLDSLPHLSPS